MLITNDQGRYVVNILLVLLYVCTYIQWEIITSHLVKKLCFFKLNITLALA